MATLIGVSQGLVVTPPNSLGIALPEGGLFASAGIPFLDAGIVPLNASNTEYLKLIDAIFLLGGLAVIIYGLSRKSIVTEIIGGVLIMAGITGFTLGWD